MITIGIDIGLENIKIAALKDQGPAVCKMASSGLADRKDRAMALYNAMLAELGCEAPDRVVVTGQGASDLAGMYKVTEPIADAAYARSLDPDAKMVVDVGADQVRVVSLGEGGRIDGCVLNQKCSACIGLTLESMAMRLDMSMDAFGAVDPEDCGEVKVNSGCSVFSELDALESLFNGCEKEKAVGAMIHAAAVRVNALLHDKFEPSRVNSFLIGGVAQNKAFVQALEKRSGIRFTVPAGPVYGCAIGCAVIGRSQLGQ